MTPENIVTQIKQSTNYQVNKQILREKIQTDLHIAHNGGLFKITPDLIAFLNSWDLATIYLEDTYNNPIEVSRLEFLKLCQEQYHQVMNRWHMQHDEIKRARKI